MSLVIIGKLGSRLQQLFEMENLKIPTFLNTVDKYTEVIRATDTVKKYEDLFYKLLGDDSIALRDVLQLMKNIERDVILVHGIKEVSHLLDLTESYIRYMIAMVEDSDEKKKGKKTKYTTDTPTSKKEQAEPEVNPDQGYMTCDCDCDGK